jgi:GxxExxY protein
MHFNRPAVHQLHSLESFMCNKKNNHTTKIKEMEIEISDDDTPKRDTSLLGGCMKHTVIPPSSKLLNGGAFFTALPAYIAARTADPTMSTRSVTTITPTSSTTDYNGKMDVEYTHTSSATDYNGKMDIEDTHTSSATHHNEKTATTWRTASVLRGSRATKVDIEAVMFPLKTEDDDDTANASQQNGSRTFNPMEVHEEMMRIFKDVYKRHGPGLSESTYQRAAVRRAYLDGLPVMMERELFADFGDGNLLIGRVDIEVASSCLYELKIGTANPQVHTPQVLKYIRAYDSSASDDIKIASLVYFTPTGVVMHEVRNDCAGRAKHRR